MKEVRYFYVPDAAVAHELPADEAGHMQYGCSVSLLVTR